MSACVWASPSSARSGGILFILLPCCQVATSQRLDFPMTLLAQIHFALRAAACSRAEWHFRSSAVSAAHSSETTLAQSVFHHGVLLGWYGFRGFMEASVACCIASCT